MLENVDEELVYIDPGHLEPYQMDILMSSGLHRLLIDWFVYSV